MLSAMLDESATPYPRPALCIFPEFIFMSVFSPVKALSKVCLVCERLLSLNGAFSFPNGSSGHGRPEPNGLKGLGAQLKTARRPRRRARRAPERTKRSATSVPSNIAEGCGRSGDKELARFRSIAAGSTSELDYQLLLARSTVSFSR
jgi:hypothetical protein